MIYQFLVSSAFQMHSYRHSLKKKEKSTNHRKIHILVMCVLAFNKTEFQNNWLFCLHSPLAHWWLTNGNCQNNFFQISEKILAELGFEHKNPLIDSYRLSYRSSAWAQMQGSTSNTNEWYLQKKKTAFRFLEVMLPK